MKIWELKLKNGVISLESVKDRLVTVRGELALLDCDVAAFYGVETKRVNEAVKNNQEKFPSDYMYALTTDEAGDLRSKISTTKLSSKSRSLPKAFTEKGLYMLATVLKSRQATAATLAIIETFANVRAIKRELFAVSRLRRPAHRAAAEQSETAEGRPTRPYGNDTHRPFGRVGSMTRPKSQFNARCRLDGIATAGGKTR